MQQREKIETFLAGKRPATRLFFAAFVAILALYSFDPTVYGIFPRCPLYTLTGWQCAGCGTLRAIHALSHGHLQTAFHFNPLLVLVLPFIGFGFAREIRLESRGQRTNWNAIPAPAIWAVIILLVGYGVLRNFISLQ